MSDVQALMPEGTQHLIEKIKAEKEDVFRLSTIPTASAENVGRIVQFIGTTSGGYTHGYFYECKENSGSYSWQQTDIQPDVDISGKEDKFRYTTMPTASADNLGQVVQYLGESTQTYTQGSSYKCVLDGSTYKWVTFGGVKDDRIGDEITNIKVRMNDGARPYITVNIAQILAPFSSDDVALSDILSVADAYYSGEATLEDIQKVWHVGDTKTISLTSMNGLTGEEIHPAQTVTMRIVDFGHDNLTTPINGQSKAFMTLAFKLANDGVMNPTLTNAGGWNATPRRTWCNEVCFNAIPEELRTGIKYIDKVRDSGSSGFSTEITSSDRVFLPSAKELKGTVSLSGGADGDAAGWSGYSYSTSAVGVDGGTQYELYKTAYPYDSKVSTSTACSAYFYTSSETVSNRYFVKVNANGSSQNICNANYMGGLAPHFCI